MKHLSLICSSLLLLLMFNFVQAQTGMSYRYAYTSRTGDDEYIVHLVDPVNGETETLLVPPLEGFRVRYVVASPDGVWLAAILSRIEVSDDRIHGSHALRLYSLVNGETRDMFDDQSFGGIYWSPDSQWLAFISYDLESRSNLGLIHVYHVPSDTYVSLDTPQQLVYGLSWSTDSRRLLTAVLVCEGNTNCNESLLQILNMPSMEVVQSATFDTIGDRVCEFTWSPDMQIIAFRYSCGDGLGMGWAEYFNDLYLWRLSSNTIEQVTFFAQQVANGSSLIPYSFRDSFVWYDNEHLFNSIYGGLFEGGIGFNATFMQQGLFVLRPDGTEHRLDQQPRMSLTLNPMYPAEIAYRRETHVFVTNEYDMLMSEISEANIEVATFDGTSFNVLYTGAAGCDFRWSPDGAILAYSVYDFTRIENCERELQGLEFVNRETWSSSSFDIPEENAYVIGWLINRTEETTP